MKRLKAHAKTYTGATSTAKASELGALLLVSGVTGANATDFGGVNLIRTLHASRR